MEIKSPVQPGSVVEFISFDLGITNLTNPTTGALVYIPQITMYVAPSSLSFQYKKIIHREKTRGGWLEQHWGEDLDVVSATSSTGTFQILGTGLTTVQRYTSLAKINFQEVFYMFKNNGCVYDSNGNIIAQGDVYINYDNFQMFGQFENFSWTEDASLPYKWNFTFTFQVTKSTRNI